MNKQIGFLTVFNTTVEFASVRMVMLPGAQVSRGRTLADVGTAKIVANVRLSTPGMYHLD